MKYHMLKDIKKKEKKKKKKKEKKKKKRNACEKFVCNRKATFLGVFRAMWRIHIHATYKIGTERICHTYVTNAFEICDEFVRANNSHVWKIRGVNIEVQQSYLHADNEDSDQTGRMPRLIWVFAGHTLILLVLSCRGSIFLKFCPILIWL